MPPDHFIAIHAPLYLDPECRYVDTEQRPLAAGWVSEAVAALDEFSRDVAAWAARSSEDKVVCLRFDRAGDLVSEAVFDHESLPVSALPALARFVEAVTEANRAGALWSDDEHHLGGAVATVLAERSRAEVPTFVRFLETNDLDHEVDQHLHIERVVRAHGWCPQTLALWVARLGTCAGQHGHETPWAEYAPSLAEYVGGDGARRELLVSLLAGNMAALVDSSLAGGGEGALSALAANQSVYWNDLHDQGLGELAAGVVAEARERAEERVRAAAGAGQGLSDWLRLPNG